MLRFLLAAALAVAGCGARSELPADATGASSGASSSSASGGGAACPVTELAGDRSGGLFVALDATHAYWTTLNGNVQRGSLEDGTIDTLASFASTSAAIAVDGEHVYVASESGLARGPKTGGALEPLVSTPWNPVDVVVRSGVVYVLDRGSGIFASRLLRWSADAGLTTLVDMDHFDLAVAMAADESGTYVTCSGALVDGAFVSHPLVRVSDGGSAIAVLAQSLGDPFDVAVRGDTIYLGTWGNEDGDAHPVIWSLPKAGGAGSAIPLGVDSLPLAMALDDRDAYVTVPAGPAVNGAPPSKLLRVDLSGGAVTTVVEDPSAFFTSPAVTATHVAYTVQRLPDGPTAALADVEVRCK